MKKLSRFMIATLFLIGVIVFSVTGTVVSHSNKNLEIQEKYYQEMEREYVQQVRGYLNELGYVNSGVMLTHVVNEDGSRQYTVTVHNERLEKLSQQERREISEAILDIAFEAPDCDFFQEFLVS